MIVKCRTIQAWLRLMGLDRRSLVHAAEVLKIGTVTFRWRRMAPESLKPIERLAMTATLAGLPEFREPHGALTTEEIETIKAAGRAISEAMDAAYLRANGSPDRDTVRIEPDGEDVKSNPL